MTTTITAVPAPNRPEPPRVVGAVEIADLMKVKLQTVHAWKQRDQLPPPDYESVNGYSAWLYDTILHWAGQTGRLNKSRHRKLVADYRTRYDEDPAPHHPRGRRPAGDTTYDEYRR
jgi:hypothetical protein